MADNLTYDNIILDIKNNIIKNLYLFYGPESLLINDVISRIESKIINPAFRSLNLLKLDGTSVTYDEIINACETLPFLDSRKLVIIKDCGFFKGKKSQNEGLNNETGMEHLCEYISNISESTVLIFIAGEEVDKRKKIYTIIKKYGNVVEFAPLKGQGLIEWVVKAFKNHGKLINKVDASYMCQIVTGSLEDMMSEITKVCSYAGSRTEISKTDIDAVVSKSLELNIFQLVDLITAKKLDHAMLVLNDLLLDGQAVPVILAMIIRQYRLLLNIKLLSQKGYSSSEICRKLGVMPFVVSNLIRISRYYEIRDIEDKLRQCLDADISIKTGRMEQRIAIESLIVKFAQS